MTNPQVVACAITLMIMTPLALMMLGHYVQSRMEKVFPDNEWAVWEQGRLYVEDFYNKSRVQAQRKLQHLDCSISFAQLDENQVEEHFYEKCIQNLKRAAPSLRFLALNGGYIYNPANMTNESLLTEMLYLNAHFSIVAEIIRRRGMIVTNFDFNGVVVMDKEFLASTNFTSVVQSAFNFTHVESPKKSGVDVKFQFITHNTTINVFLSASAAELFRQSPPGRSKFYLPRMRLEIPPGGRH